VNSKPTNHSIIHAKTFFNRDPQVVAVDLLGKLLCHKFQNQFLAMRIIDVEAYYLNEKGSHASLGYTEKRKALFMPAGSIYMYYARGKDSFNISCKGKGNAILIKSAIPSIINSDSEIKLMQELNKNKNGTLREINKLGSGQTLLCKSLALKVSKWDAKQFKKNNLDLRDDSYLLDTVIQSRRLGIPKGRNEELLLRFTDLRYAEFATTNPLKSKFKYLLSDLKNSSKNFEPIA
jgi:DNA-3-methyladenine glycosylase